MSVASLHRCPEDRASGAPRQVLPLARGVSESWFYKWHDRAPTARQQRRAELDAAVKASFDDSGGTPGTYGSPRVFEDLVEAGWKVSVNTVAASMARQGLRGPLPETQATVPDPPGQGGGTDPGPGQAGLHRRADRSALVRRPHRDPHRRGQALPGHRRGPGLAAAARLRDQRASRLGGRQGGAVHGRRRARRRRRRGRSSTPTKAASTSATCSPRPAERSGVTQSMGRVGSALDNAAAESWNSTLEHELLSRRHFTTKDQARRAVAPFIDAYNHRRRHCSCEMLPPVAYEAVLAARPPRRHHSRRRHETGLSDRLTASKLGPGWHQGAGE